MADDIITSLEIIEKLLFPETDFWHDNYLKKTQMIKTRISSQFYNMKIVGSKLLRSENNSLNLNQSKSTDYQ